MLLFSIFLAVLLVMALSFGGVLWRALHWGREWQELKECGIETSGIVIEKRSVRSRGNTSTHIRYEYMDQFGHRHKSRRNLVTPDAWDAHIEGGPIQVVYSEKRPSVSWPKYLVDLGPPRITKHRAPSTEPPAP